VQIRLLGPVDVLTAGQVVPLGSPKQRAALAAFAVDAGRVVQVDTLIARIWGQQPPDGARRTLHTYVAQTRRLLEAVSAGKVPVRLVRGGGGYTLEIERDRVDLHRFRDLVRRGTSNGSTVRERTALIGEAMAMWQDAPLAGIGGEWADRIRDKFAPGLPGRGHRVGVGDARFR
jgi:DNA-binding SARP family transcriptional activator